VRRRRSHRDRARSADVGGTRTGKTVAEASTDRTPPSTSHFFTHAIAQYGYIAVVMPVTAEGLGIRLPGGGLVWVGSCKR
jgi:hypothetical protein